MSVLTYIDLNIGLYRKKSLILELIRAMEGRSALLTYCEA